MNAIEYALSAIHIIFLPFSTCIFISFIISFPDSTYPPGDCIYIFSDGFVDQFGGDNNKKFKSSNFKKLILSVQEKPMDSQKELFARRKHNYLGVTRRAKT